jgi:hypothetical protein
LVLEHWVWDWSASGLVLQRCSIGSGAEEWAEDERGEGEGEGGLEEWRSEEEWEMKLMKTEASPLDPQPEGEREREREGWRSEEVKRSERWN